MKFVLLGVLTCLFAACSTAPKLTCDEQCALSGMVCKGITFGNSSEISQNSLSSAFGVSESKSTSVRCERDESKNDAIASFRQQADEKLNPTKASYPLVDGADLSQLKPGTKLTPHQRMIQYQRTGGLSDYKL